MKKLIYFTVTSCSLLLFFGAFLLYHMFMILEHGPLTIQITSQAELIADVVAVLLLAVVAITNLVLLWRRWGYD